MEGLKALYSDYDRQVADLRKKAGLFDGVMGFGADPRRHPCHEAFYEQVKAWTQAFSDAGPTPEAAEAVVSFLIETPAHNREGESYWFMYAAMVFMEPVIPCLSKPAARALAARMDFLFPRYDRMPAHQAVYKRLQKAGK